MAPDERCSSLEGVADAELWVGSLLTDEVLFRAFGASASTSELPLHRPR